MVPHTVALDQVSFEEASELAYCGAQVLHPVAVQPAMKYNVPVRVKNSCNPSAVGTIIQREKSGMGRLVRYQIFVSESPFQEATTTIL